MICTRCNQEVTLKAQLWMNQVPTTICGGCAIARQVKGFWKEALYMRWGVG